jgi:hypothetical protein
MIVNLYGGPGCGKSTTAAGVFSKLKLAGINAELVTEYAKDLTWEKSFKILGNQNLVTAEQHHRLWRLNEVDVVVTDSPLLLGTIYCNDMHLQNHIHYLYNQFDNVNFLLNRVKSYQEKGRSQTEEQAIKLDKDIERIISNYSYTSINGDASGIDLIANNIMSLV